MNYCLPGEQRLYDRGPASHDRTIRDESKGLDRARITLLNAIKDMTAEIPADTAAGSVYTPDVLIDNTKAIDLWCAVSFALNGDRDAAVKRLVEIANSAAATFGFAASSAYEDGAQG